MHLNWFLFNAKHTQQGVHMIDVPQSSILQHCQKIFAEEILKVYKFPVEISSIGFWTPKEALPADTLIDEEWMETHGVIKALAKPIALVRTFSSALGGKEKNSEIVHVIVTAKQPICLNWFLFDAKGAQAFSEIEIHLTLFNGKVRHCQEIFAKEILEAYKFPVEIESIEFWKTKEDLPVDIIDKEWMETHGVIKTLAKPIALGQTFSSALGGKEKNREIVHVIVTAKPHIHLNWFLFDAKHTQPGVRIIEVPQSPFLQQCQKIFAEEILKVYKFSVKIESIKFWKLKEDLPADTLIDEEWMETHGVIKALAKPIALGQTFSSALAQKLNDSTIVHIVVTAEEESKHDNEENDKVHPLPESLRFDRAVKAKGMAPSEGARPAEYALSQRKEEETIYDGRYPSPTSYTLAPPIEIYHRIFHTFFRLLEDPPQPTADDLINTRKLMDYLCEISDGREGKRNAEVFSKLGRILDQSLLAIENEDGTKPDGTIRVSVDGQSVPIMIVELKKELGHGSCDPSTQAGLSMKRSWIVDSVENIRNKCCCPTFLLCGGGPWLGILGAVFVDRVIVQRLTDMHWFGLSSTEEDKRLWGNTRILLALRESLKQLASFYENNLADIPPRVTGAPHPRFYPYPTSYPHSSANGTRREIKFEYQRALELDSGCVTFLARTVDEEEPKNIVVKYVARYGEKAHRFLADLKHAPELFYYGPLPDTPRFRPMSDEAQKAHPGLSLRPDTMHMVVMGYIECESGSLESESSGLSSSDLRGQLEKILFKLHGEGYAFGDLQKQNVLVDSRRNVKLIDFNWCGEYNTGTEYDRRPFSKYVRNKLVEVDKKRHRATQGPYAHYPSSLSYFPDIWPFGVGPLKPILPEHDWALLEKLF